MDLKKWHVFLAVSKYENFTKAGEELGYTQSGITQMMKNLQREVGFPLFNKTNHGITLSPEGIALLPSIRNLIAANESLKQEISFLKGAELGTLKIGTYTSCSIHWSPKIIREFQKKNPGILFDIIEGHENEIADWVLNYQVDIGFTSFQKSQTADFIPVHNDEMMAILPKGHPWTEYDEIPLEWFQNAPFIICEYTYTSDIHQILKKYKIRPDIKYTTHNDFSVLSMVEHNLGISILPELVIRGHVGDYEVRTLKPYVFRKLGMAVHPSHDWSPAMKIFIRYAKEYLLT